MNDFKSIDELLRVLEREKLLLKQMFQKRPSTSLKYDYTLELTEYKEERIKYLIDYGIIRDSGNFLEMEDVYLKFFEEVLQVNENINVSFVDDYLMHHNVLHKYSHIILITDDEITDWYMENANVRQIMVSAS